MSESKTQSPADIAVSIEDVYRDDDFPTTLQSIGEADGIDTNPTWVRPRHFAPDTPALFTGGAGAGDICQGQLGDCWFLGGLAVVANRQDLIRSCIAYNDPDNKGLYAFSFYKFGEWHEVVVDDRIPCNDKGPMFASGKDPNETWVMLIEKAYAKLHTTYGALVGGWTNDALVDLTGGVPDTIFFGEIQEDIESGRFFDRLHRMQTSGRYLMGCARSTSGTREADTGRGVLQGHAYSILDIKIHEGTRLVRCRNPWGCTEWSGPWSDKDPRWTPALLAEFDYTLGDDGTFWISYEDFVTEFNKVYVCHVIDPEWNKVSFKSAWRGSSAGGCANHSTWKNNKQYQLVIYEASEFVISIQQRDPRQTGSKGVPIGCVVLHAGDEGVKSTTYQPAATTEISNLRELVIEETLQPGIYNLMPFTFEADVECEYFLSVWSPSEFSLKSLDGESPVAGSMPIPARPLPPVQPRPAPPAVQPTIVSKHRAQDDPGIISKIVGMALKALGPRFPQMATALTKGDMAGNLMKMVAGGMGGAGAGAGAGAGGDMAAPMAAVKKCCSIM